MSTGQGSYGSLANAGAILTGITLASYALGWIRFRNYFAAFGSPWITSMSPVSSIVSNGALPVVFLVVAYSVSQYAIEDLYDRNQTLRDVSIFGITSGILLVGALALSTSSYHTLALQACRASLFFFAFCLCTTIEYGRRELQLNGYFLSKDLFAVGVGLSIIYLLITGTLGKVEGWKSRSVDASNLHWVQVEKTKQFYRLVHVNKNSIYAAQLQPNGEVPQVKVMRPEEINFISTVRDTTKSQ